MRFSMFPGGVFAVLVGLSLLPSARAQRTDGQGDRAQVDQKAIAAWMEANQGANAQGQAHARWFRKGDNLAWFTGQPDRSSGIDLVPVDDALRSHLKLPKDQGLLVTGIDPHSRAAAAGVHQNDVLLKLGETPLGKPDDVDAALKAAGDKPVVLHLYRDGTAREIQVQPEIQVSFGPVSIQPPAPQFWIGVSVADVEPALRAQLRLPTNKGLLVNEVFKESPAEKAGVKVNDILLAVNGTSLSDQKKLVDLVQGNGEKTLAVELLHEGKPREHLEITPQRRKVIGLAVDPAKQVQALRWDVVRPGAVLTQTQPYQLEVRDLQNVFSALESNPKEQQPKDQSAVLAKRLDELASMLRSATKEQQSKEPTAALAKRLDEMHAELEKVLKVLAEVNAALKANEDVKQAIELLKKHSADKK